MLRTRAAASILPATRASCFTSGPYRAPTAITSKSVLREVTPYKTRRIFLFSASTLGLSTMARAENEDDQKEPENFAVNLTFNISHAPYIHLWVDSEGETHIKDAKMKGFELKKYAADPQFVKDDIETPTKVVFTELSPGIEQDFHPCPEVQFVACLAGAWKIRTTDGAERTMRAGEVLFQDDVEKSPAKKTPKHWSAVVGDQPCQQMVIQVGNRKPQVDKPGVL